MTVHSLTQALEDTAVLHEIARKAGTTVAQARTVLALLADINAQQMVRMCATARADRVRAVNRETRKR